MGRSKGRCARRTKKIVRKIGRELKPIGIKLISGIVADLASRELTGPEKRSHAIERSRDALRNAGIQAGETAIRAMIEASVVALGTDGAINDLGLMADDEAD